MPRRLPSCLRGDEPDRLLAAAPTRRDRLLIGCGLLLGLRVAELVGLRVEALDLARGVCMVWRGKGDKDRAVPIPARLLPELAAWLDGRTGGWLFPSPRSRTAACRPAPSS
jgi:integrase